MTIKIPRKYSRVQCHRRRLGPSYMCHHRRRGFSFKYQLGGKFVPMKFYVLPRNFACGISAKWITLVQMLMQVKWHHRHDCLMVFDIMLFPDRKKFRMLLKLVCREKVRTISQCVPLRCSSTRSQTTSAGCWLLGFVTICTEELWMTDVHKEKKLTPQNIVNFSIASGSASFDICNIKS